MRSLGIPIPLVAGTKRPLRRGWQHLKDGDFEPVDSWYGINPAPDIVVVDADPRGYVEGTDSLQQLIEDAQLRQTYTVRTPSGGWHLYYTKPEEWQPRLHDKRYPGVELRTTGMYVVAPGAQHNEKRYEVVDALEPQPVPQELIGLWEEKAAPDPGVGMHSDESVAMLSEFISDCQQFAPSVQGRGGNNQLYRLACRAHDYGLPLDVARNALWKYFNPRCEPPWIEAEQGQFSRIIENAYNYAQNEAGSRNVVEPLAAPVIEEKEAEAADQKWLDDQLVRQIADATMRPDMKADGSLRPTLANVIYVFSTYPEWRNVFRYNSFALALEWVQAPAWRASASEGLEINERDLAHLAAWLSAKVQLNVSQYTIWQAIHAVAPAYHPVREYLRGLQWDGVPRLDRILIDTAGTIDTPYTRAVGKNVLIAAVKRIIEPGCKQDYVMVLESRQGERKSLWIETLGRPWCATLELRRGDKDTFINLRGAWIIELAELNATIRKQDVDWLKSVLTIGTDIYRPPYERQARRVPRESIFIATINPAQDWTYLRDTENRRYWPIKSRHLDIDRLKEYRDQYFAEALVRYYAGEQAWLSPELESIAKREQALRREVDPWVDILNHWVAGRKEFSTIDAYNALGLRAADLRTADRQRIYDVLKSLGYEFTRSFGGHGIWQLSAEWQELL